MDQDVIVQIFLFPVRAPFWALYRGGAPVAALAFVVLALAPIWLALYLDRRESENRMRPWYALLLLIPPALWILVSGVSEVLPENRFGYPVVEARLKAIFDVAILIASASPWYIMMSCVALARGYRLMCAVLGQFFWWTAPIGMLAAACSIYGQCP